MPARVVSRPAETRAITQFLGAAAAAPAALVIEGEAGIGKTTLWLSGIDRAAQRGFRVLSARPAAAESVLAYAGLADMLDDADPDRWADLPSPQRLALDRVMLRAEADGMATDPHAVAAGFLSVVKRFAGIAPVLLAVDDLQWLDASSAQVVAFVARRLKGPVGVLGTVRTDPEDRNAAAWLQLPTPDGVRRIELGPFSFGGLRALVSKRLGRSFSRPTMLRIHEVSQGNPFYALELARVTDDRTFGTEPPLPGTLAELVRARIDGLDSEVQDALLAASCVATPTIELVARAIDRQAERVVGLLVDAEEKGIVRIDGHLLCFTHPLLARGVYTRAGSARRRAMHRRLAEIIDEPELQARHMAMAVAWGDPDTLQCLDRAAERARMRGAPAAAAELLGLAVGLGGDTPERTIRLASHHCDAGDVDTARDLFEQTIARTQAGPLRAEGLSRLAVMNLLDGSFLEAVGLLARGLSEAAGQFGLRVPMLITQAMVLFNVGRRADAVRSIEDAIAEATQFGDSHLLSQAISMREMLRVLGGGGLDEVSMGRALALEDQHAGTAVIFRPSTQHALFLAWTGRLQRAREEMAAVRRRCTERGEESDLIFVDAHGMLIEIWRGDFAEAARLAEDAMERARQIGGDAPLSFALMMRAACAAYGGRPDDARRNANHALAASHRGYSFILAQWPSIILGFLEVSLGNYEAALTTLQPLLSRLDSAPEATEIYVASFVPDAVEALVQLHRLAETEPLVEALEHNGRRLDRAWMMAVGARCRSMLHAARGDLDAATLAAQTAMAEHERLPMPFERARTQLLLGQLQRRQRLRVAATTTLSQALDAFEAMGTPLWADRARAELERASAARGRGGLSASEQRVAELAAAGLTNCDVAAALFISPKTVEANLARIYRKLGIHSRAELGRRMGDPTNRETPDAPVHP